MIGNVWEWTADWVGQGLNADDGFQPKDGDFYGDMYKNVDSAEFDGSFAEGTPKFPASPHRGGGWSVASGAGVFALALDSGPVNWQPHIGARCCLR